MTTPEMDAAESTLADAIGGTPYDLIVIGAGINGAGIARDAALRGMRVLLVDKGDLSAGTSSWSSRLIHGGLRYLEHGEIGLVRESLRERERLLRNAPHLVHPLPLTLPIYKGHQRGPLMIRAGMVAYDALSFDKSLPRHRMFSARQALEHEPGLNPEGLAAAARYYDAQVEYTERLIVENVLEAMANGATVATYTQVERLVVEAGVIRGAVLTDLLTGETATATGRVTVNVTGSWVDTVLAESGIETAQRLVGGTKGTHIVVHPFPGAPSDALYIEARQDGRPYFIIPWNGLYLIGTTDVRYDGDLDRVVPSEEEIAYLLTESNLAIPAAGLTREQVLYAYAGLRPLPWAPEGKEGSITRKHIIHDHAPQYAGLLSIIGGKLTTFRSLAEETVDAVGEKLGRRLPPERTSKEPLPGAVAHFGQFAERFRREAPEWIGPRSVEHLLRVYGTRARAVLALADGEPDLRAVVSEETGAIGATVAFAFTDERARTLTDAVLRRTMIGYAADAGFGAVEASAAIAQRALGWTDERRDLEIEAYRTYMTRFLPLAEDMSVGAGVAG
ncbi:MAG TPA: glycerol-3-phosphate dehydrogenase [Thermomicrobiales bacterium]|nr:glycerol-3-phosphate dehydrogenase [Thermomicrobiales bacterium]